MATLALWVDFWDWDGAPGSISVEAVLVLSPYTTGGARGVGTDNSYRMLPDDYWEAREAAAIGKDIPKADVTVPKSDEATATPAPKVDDEARSGLLESMRNASSLDELRSLSDQLRGGT